MPAGCRHCAGEKTMMTKEQKQLYDAVCALQPEILEEIRNVAAIPSVYETPVEGAPYGKPCREALDHVLALGEKLGMKAVNVGNRAGYLEIGEGSEMVAALGHLDVVPAGRLSDWTVPPFAAAVIGDRLYGRGVLDDKGPVISAIYGMKAIRDLGLPIGRRIRVIFGTDEERGSSCVRYYVESGEEQPVMGFTPDAEYPLIFFEKGMTGALIGRKNPEQGPVKVISFKGGTAKNVVPVEACLVLEGEQETVKEALSGLEGISVLFENGKTVCRAEGVSAHGSTPEKGVSAVLRLLAGLKPVLPAIGGDLEKTADFLLEEIGTETNGQKLGFRFYDEETGETTVNAGLIRFDEKEASFTLDIRYPKNGDHETVRKALEEKAAAYGLSVLDRSVTDCLYVPKDSELVRKLMGVYRAVTGRSDEPVAIGGGTYAKEFRNMVAFGSEFPEDENNIHAPDEFVRIDRLMTAAALSALALYELARN